MGVSQLLVPRDVGCGGVDRPGRWCCLPSFSSMRLVLDIHDTTGWVVYKQTSLCSLPPSRATVVDG